MQRLQLQLGRQSNPTHKWFGSRIYTVNIFSYCIHFYVLPPKSRAFRVKMLVPPQNKTKTDPKTVSLVSVDLKLRTLHIINVIDREGTYKAKERQRIRGPQRSPKVLKLTSNSISYNFGAPWRFLFLSLGSKHTAAYKISF